MRLTVYEVINEPRREVFVGATDLPIFELVARMAKRLPEPIRHWDLKDATTVRSVEFDLPPEAARDFILKYVKTRLPRGWRYLTEDGA